MVGQTQLWRISILVEMGCAGTDLDFVLIWVEISNGFCEMMGLVTVLVVVLGGWGCFGAISHASRGKEIYYFIIMLCKIKNEM